MGFNLDGLILANSTALCGIQSLQSSSTTHGTNATTSTITIKLATSLYGSTNGKYNNGGPNKGPNRSKFMKRGGKKRPNGPPRNSFDKKYRVNDRIRARQVRVIGPEGGQIGIMSKYDAIAKAKSFGLDLVEIAQYANPPVCKIADFGKMRYEHGKKQKQQRKKKSQPVKTVQFRPNIGEADLNRKITDIQKFLDKGHRVVVQVTMRGRQRRHSRLAETLTIDKIQETLVDAVMEKPQHQGGRITVAFSKVIPKVVPEALRAVPETSNKVSEAGDVNEKT